MKKIIGSTTTYQGTEHPYLKGTKIRIVAVLKNAARPDIDLDGPDHDYISDDIDLERVGGVTAFDRMEVQPLNNNRYLRTQNHCDYQVLRLD